MYVCVCMPCINKQMNGISISVSTREGAYTIQRRDKVLLKTYKILKYEGKFTTTTITIKYLAMRHLKYVF